MRSLRSCVRVIFLGLLSSVTACRALNQDTVPTATPSANSVSVTAETPIASSSAQPVPSSRATEESSLPQAADRQWPLAKDDLTYMTHLAVMKGYLLMAEQLSEAEQYDRIKPLLGNALEQLYQSNKDYFKQLGISPFDQDLKTLADLAQKSPQDAAFLEQLQTVGREVDRAIAALPPSRLQSPQFNLAVILNLLHLAQQDYYSAIVPAKGSNPAVYQRSRGFVIYSNDRFQQIVNQLSPAQRQIMNPVMKELMKVWSSLDPPTHPGGNNAAIAAFIAQMEIHSQERNPENTPDKSGGQAKP